MCLGRAAQLEAVSRIVLAPTMLALRWMMRPTTEDEQFRLTEAISVLEATPGVLHSLLGGLPGVWLDFSEDPDAWSPRTVLVHFVHNEQTNWMPRARVILSDTEVRRFPPFRQLPEESTFEGLTIGQLLREFEDLREENLSALRSLDLQPDDFAREAEHPVLGIVNLRELLATWVVHDLNHLHQIAKSMAKRYRGSVGPWRPNLALLDL